MTQVLGKSQDLVSIVIPVHNTGKYLEECLNSCLEQTYSNVEVVAVDDCSTDPLTIEILKKFEQQDPRVRVIWSKPNRGQGYCRNLGVEHCRGKYFAFIDSDDYFKPEFVEKMYEGLEEYQTDFAICDTHNYIDDPRLYDITRYQINDSATRFNFNSKDKSVVNNFDLASVGFLISFPASCYGKMFNTQKYRDSGLRFYDGEYSFHCQDEDWSTYSILLLKNFLVLKFTGLMRRMHYGTASMPSLRYFRCSVDAAYRRYVAVKTHHFSHLYENSIISNLLDRMRDLCFITEKYEDRLKLIDLTHDYLAKSNDKFNINPYIYSWVSSSRWHNILAGLDIEPLPILYFSYRPLHNSNWKECYATKQLLENLAAHGIFTTSFTSLDQDSVVPVQQCMAIEKEMLFFAENDPDFEYDDSAVIFNFKDNGVNCLIAKTTPCTKLADLTEHDLMIFNDGLTKTVTSYFKKKQKGVLLVSGGSGHIQRLCAKLKQPDYKLVYLIDDADALHFENSAGQDVLNLDGKLKSIDDAQTVPNDTQYIFGPQDFDAIVSMNPYYAERFIQLYGVKVRTMGYVVNPLVSAMRENTSKMITFAHPNGHQGLALVIKIVSCFAKLYPKQQFLIVQDEEQNAQKELLKLHDAQGRTLAKLKLPLKNINLVSYNQLNPISVATQTSVLLAPALDNDATLSNVLECQIKDIPILASDIAKYQAILGPHDRMLPIPESMRKDPYCLPSDEEIKPWIKAIEELLPNTHPKRTMQERQDTYRKICADWVHMLYELANVPEVHEHPNDQRTL